MKLFLIVSGFVFGLIGVFSPKAEAQGCPGSPTSQEWIACHNAVINACAFAGFREVDACRARALQRYIGGLTVAKGPSGGVRPVNAFNCPSTHPIKGNFTTYSGERCIYHPPGGQFYNVTKPEMCYVNPADAIADGCRASQR